MTSEADLLHELEAAVSKGGYESALSMLKAKVEQEPANAAARFFLATAYQTNQNYTACIQEVRTAEKLGIIDDRLMGILWVCLDESGQREEALTSATQAVARFPKSGESHKWYGLSLLQHDKEPDARMHFEEALRRAPEDATSWYMLAQLYRKEGFVVPSFLTYMRFFAVEPDGSRAEKARTQVKALLDVKLLLTFAGETQMEARLSVGDDGPTGEGDFREAQQAMAVYAGATRNEPSLNARKLARTIDKVISALPSRESVPAGSFTLDNLAPYFEAARREKLLDGLADVVLPEQPDRPTPEAVKFLRWSEAYQRLATGAEGSRAPISPAKH